MPPCRRVPGHERVVNTYRYSCTFRCLLVHEEQSAISALGFVQLAVCLPLYRKPRHARILFG